MGLEPALSKPQTAKGGGNWSNMMEPSSSERQLTLTEPERRGKHSLEAGRSRDSAWYVSINYQQQPKRNDLRVSGFEKWWADGNPASTFLLLGLSRPSSSELLAVQVRSRRSVALASGNQLLPRE